MSLLNLRTIITEQARQSYEAWTPYSAYYAGIALLVPLAGAYDILIAESCYNTIPLRIAMAIPMIAIHFLLPFPSTTDKYGHIVWATGIAFVLPFGFGHMLLQSASCAAAANTSDFYVVQYIAALFLMIQLAGSFHLAISIWIAGTLPALLALLISNISNADELSRVSIEYAGIYATLLICGSLAAQTNRLLENARAQVGHLIGSNIAHELRTPLATIRASSNGPLRHLKTITTGYSKAAAGNLIDRPLRTQQIKGLADGLDLVRSEVDYANILIDILLINTSFKSTKDYPVDSFSAGQCVYEAIERYPYANQKERQLVSVSIHNDFDIEAPRTLVIHVLLNLLKNSVYFVQRSADPKITIEVGFAHERRIVVTDNGPGIQPTQLKYIFNRYYSTTSAGEGAGIGLSFCRLVMDGIGGSVECRSIPGETTKFILSFRY